MLRENRSSGVKGCCDPSRQYAPPGSYFFVILETAAQPLTSLSTKPLDLIPNNPTARPPLSESTVEDHKNVRMPGPTFLKTPLIDGSLASGPYQQGHSVSREQHSVNSFHFQTPK